MGLDQDQNKQKQDITPWTVLFRQVSRDAMTRINLNKYWNKFGEMLSPKKDKVGQKRKFSSVKKQLSFDVSEKFDNRDNGVIKGRYVLLSEVDENIANEIKELTSFSESVRCHKCMLE